MYPPRDGRFSLAPRSSIRFFPLSISSRLVSFRLAVEFELVPWPQSLRRTDPASLARPRTLDGSLARESNKATWVVAYLVLLLFSPSFHLSSSLFLPLSLFLSMNIDFSTRMYPPRDGRFSLALRSIRFPSQSRLISPRCRIRTRSLASVTPPM